jgi:hypothetical protein
MTTTLELLNAVPVPKKTETYTPVSHAELVNAIMEEIEKAGLKVKDQRYSCNRGGLQMFGNLTLVTDHAEQEMNIGFRNSYDKSMQLGIVTGSRVIVCSNLMFSGETQSVHMHKGEIASEIHKVAADSVAIVAANFKKILADSKKLKSKKIDQAVINELIGGLFLEQELISVTQLGLIRSELKESKNFGSETLWDLYNHTTEALKATPVRTLIDSHLTAHNYFMARC